MLGAPHAERGPRRRVGGEQRVRGGRRALIRGRRRLDRQAGGRPRRQRQAERLARVVDPFDRGPVDGRRRGAPAVRAPAVHEHHDPLVPVGQVGQHAGHRPAGRHRLRQLRVGQRVDEGPQPRQLRLVLRHVRSIRRHVAPPRGPLIGSDCHNPARGSCETPTRCRPRPNCATHAEAMDVLAAHAARHPDKPALVEGDRVWSWAEFIGRRNRLGHGSSRSGSRRRPRHRLRRELARALPGLGGGAGRRAHPRAHEPPADRGGGRLHPRPLGRGGGVRERRFLPMVEAVRARAPRVREIVLAGRGAPAVGRSPRRPAGGAAGRTRWSCRAAPASAPR